jgi:hypothetical protein
LYFWWVRRPRSSSVPSILVTDAGVLSMASAIAEVETGGPERI